MLILRRPLLLPSLRWTARGFAPLLAALALALPGLPAVAPAQDVPPVLELPEKGLDDPATYRGYTTRFYRDAAGNTLQIYINQHNGRLVNLWADAANESLSFTARDTAGQPARLQWQSAGAALNASGQRRSVRYALRCTSPALVLGHFLLHTMRLERDFQYFKRHTLPFDAGPFIPNELTELISTLERQPAGVRARHLALLQAKNAAELRSRLVPQIRQFSRGRVRVTRTTFDGRNHLAMELAVDSLQAALEIAGATVTVRSRHNRPVQLDVQISTDSPALTPLRRQDIFNAAFFRFFDRQKSVAVASRGAPAGAARMRSFQRLERQVKSMELLASQEKLMAGLPNFATYFGRDMMMSALMLEPVWTPAMLEHVIASVLRKLTPAGEVSHEEGLGGQAIRENAAAYNRLLGDFFQQQKQGDEAAAARTLARAEELLGNLQRVTENYHMLDDDFQLPVLAARYLSRDDIPAERQRAFLQADAGRADGASRLTLLLHNLHYVAQVAQPYAEHPEVGNLIGFPKRDTGRWASASWRDSGAGYANGRYAMDINAVWVPNALAALEKITGSLRQLDFAVERLVRQAPDLRGSRLENYLQQPESLRRAVETWRGAIRHFEVRLSAQEVAERVGARLAWLPETERRYWQKIADSTPASQGIAFLALSLDANGRPIPVANTDVATWLFLENLTGDILNGKKAPAAVLGRLRIFVTPFPIGLFLAGVGPAVANDAYASPEVWENFRGDRYHSPRVVWGREVNLLLLGLCKQIRAACDADGRLRDAGLADYVRELRAILVPTRQAVAASGLQHNELWSYRIEDDRLVPARYATTSDIQLWNLTNLAVQFLLAQIAEL